MFEGKKGIIAHARRSAGVAVGVGDWYTSIFEHAGGWNIRCAITKGRKPSKKVIQEIFSERKCFLL